MSADAPSMQTISSLALLTLCVILSAVVSPLALGVAAGDREATQPGAATMTAPVTAPSATTTAASRTTPTASPTPGPTRDQETATAENDGGITRVEYGGPGVATRARGRTYVWADGATLMNVSVQPVGEPGAHELCLALRADNRTVTDHGCRTVEVRSYGGAATFDIQTLGANGTGNRTFLLWFKRSGESGRVDTATVPIVAIERDGDVDGDSLSNEEEASRGTSLTDADTDSDGLLDGPEVMQYNSSATVADTDGDGARDGAEVEAGSDPGDPDTDGDGLLDGEEMNHYGTDPTAADTDGDGLSDWEEVKRYGTDPTEKDSDSDGLTDQQEVAQYGTDPTVADTDGDGIDDGKEVEQGTDPLEKTTDTSGGRFPVDRNATMFIGLGILLAVGGIVVYGRLDGDWPGIDGFDGTDAPSAGGGTGGSDDPSHAAHADTDAAASSGDSPPGADTTDGAAAAGTEMPDPDLLSPEQYISRLVEVNGGYMKQSDIVDQVDWSKATVSRRLSSMEEDGDIERTRMGRGKIVTLPGVELDE
ncbi:helix-turn-helix transcriptional regulator [Haloglomus halophilum]|uniref:helix-turn-helix transcriptional regulator n=1 Tax=Haloglomus halophilum TaxID=2962672 RepID=UPI0020C954EF|nr:hypothetical protein [Haloglomus halophilum]